MSHHDIVSLRTSPSRWPLRASSIAVGDPPQRAPDDDHVVNSAHAGGDPAPDRPPWLVGCCAGPGDVRPTEAPASSRRRVRSPPTDGTTKRCKMGAIMALVAAPLVGIPPRGTGSRGEFTAAWWSGT
jgi:hypothetical protein